MVLTSRLICSICSEAYTNEDSVYTTSCGHMYHFACMQSWKSRSTSCPQCRCHNPSTIRVYLELEEGEDTAGKARELQEKLEESVVKTSTIEDKLRESESNFLALQVQFTVRETEFQEEKAAMQREQQNLLESKVLKISDLENKLRESADIFFGTEDQGTGRDCERDGQVLTQTAKEPADWMKIQIAMQREIRQLQTDLNKSLNAHATTTIELAKEIQGSATLEAEKMRLQRELEQVKAQSELQKWKTPIAHKQSPQMRIPGNELEAKTAVLMHMLDSSKFNRAFTALRQSNEPTRPPTTNHNEEVNANNKKMFGTSVEPNNPKYHWLFSHAKALRQCGYKFVYVNKGMVYARLNKSTLPIAVHNREQIDAMVKQYEERRNESVDKMVNFCLNES